MTSQAKDPGALDALALLGKTAGVLALVVILILLTAYLFNRLALQRGSAGQGRLRLVSSLAVGQRERVVVVQVEDTWLVVGVANGHLSKLHELPARDPDTSEPTDGAGSDSFAHRFGTAIRRLGVR